jgi:hypothetical protein
VVVLLFASWLFAAPGTDALQTAREGSASVPDSLLESNRFMVDCAGAAGLTFCSEFGWDSAGFALVPAFPTVFCFFLSSSRAAFSVSSLSR